MKVFQRALILVHILLNLQVSFGQDFTPFNPDQAKRFQNSNNPEDNEYFFYPIQTISIGDTTHFVQYMKMTSYFVDVTDNYCQGWGGSEVPAADTSWLGRQFWWNGTTNELGIHNAINEPMVFNFNIDMGDSSKFYETNKAHY
ncbi:MAG: hypothetical protein SGI87_13240 [Flavobacteriales bacterium]|nr:hypothetical protein [Flavobacteriales bacterium]